MNDPSHDSRSDYLTRRPLQPIEAGAASPAELPLPPTARPRRMFRRRRPWTRKRLIKAIIGAILVLLLGMGGWLGYKFIQNTLKATKGNLLSLITDSKLDGESTGRVNILLAGNSADDPGHGGAQLTDSIILASLDTKDHTAFLLSIPRDTWVSVPGYGHQRINAVYPEGGMDLLQQVVETDFGITINYRTLVNYTAFKQAVDAVGGITVNIQSADPRGIYDPNIAVDTGGPVLKLKNGSQTLDGQTALALARARNDPVPSYLVRKYGSPYGLPHGDFDRAANQRLMLVALKDKAASLSTLSNPAKISSLLDAIGDNVKTDFTPGDLRRLYELSQKIPSSSIQSLSLQDSTKGINLLSDQQINGADVLVPTAGVDDFSDIKHFIQQQISSDPVVKENAQVVVLNGSGVGGAAKTEATKLEAKNINVTSYGNAPESAASNEIIVAGSASQTTGASPTPAANANPATLKLLESLLGVQTTITSRTLSAAYPNADFIVVLGTSGVSSDSTTDSSSDASTN